MMTILDTNITLKRIVKRTRGDLRGAWFMCGRTMG